MQLISLMSTNPAKILGYDGGTLRMGARADITVIDPDKKWRISSDEFKSKGRNTPFDNMKVKGQVQMTMADGKIIFRRDFT
jgi:dihydroorotase